jgi:hypothetical protein
MSDFDIIDAAQDSVKDIKKTFGKKTPWVIGGGVILAAGLGILALRRSNADSNYYPPGEISAYDPGLPTGGGGASEAGQIREEMSDFMNDLVDLQTDLAYQQQAEIDQFISDIIYMQGEQENRIAEYLDRLSTDEKTSVYSDYVTFSQKSSGVVNDLISVNQGVAGKNVLESAASVEARQRERYERAAAEGNTKYMEIVKAETESALGRKVDWDSGSSKSSSSSSSSSGSSTSKTYTEGGIKYENKDGKIYKDGREIPKENYKYIPKEVGGLRD